jgi:choline-sulfatase
MAASRKLSRRSALQLGLGGAAALALAPEVTAMAAPPPDRPNILMIFSDEHNARMAGYAGHPIVQTPCLDRLARQGVAFDNAYCNSPLCSPSRQSFMSGLYPHRIGLWDNTAAMPEDTVTWAHMLSLGGYETSLVGKMHFNGYQKMYGFDRRPVLEGNDRGESFYSWGVRNSVNWRDPLPYHCGPGDRGMWDELVNAGPDIPQRQPIFRRDLEVLDGTVRMLREKGQDHKAATARRAAGDASAAARPWAICSAFVLPHPPWKARPDVLDRYRGKGDLPINWKGEGRDECDRWLFQYTGNLMNLPPRQIRRAREVYFALVSEFDEYAGRIVAALDESGLADNTVVFYFSDHGEMAGEHGLWGKVTLLESSIRVPLIVRWPGRFQAGSRVTTPVSLVDLLPTFLDLADIELPEPLFTDGHSLLPLLERHGRDFEGSEVLGEFEGEGWNHPRAFLRAGRHKYVYNHTADARLYDLEADPDELNDLSRRRPKRLREMRQCLLDRWSPADIECRVHLSQARRKFARCRNVCKDLGW